MFGKYKNKLMLLLYVFAVILIMVGISYALTESATSLGLTTGMYAVDETIYGATTFNSANLEMTPILDSEVEEKTDNVINIDFKVRGAQNNSTDRDVIYDIALTDLHLDCQLMNSEYLKWKLVKNGTTLYQGNFSNTIDNPVNNRYLLTQIQQDLISYEGTDKLDYDSYNLYIWLSDVCQEEDIGNCNVSEELLEEQNEMLGRMFYGKVEVELYTDSKKEHVKNPLPTGTDACANVKYAFLKDAGDAKVETIEIQAGKPFKKLPTPKKEGYLFGGWYLGNTKVDNDTIVESTTNIELYARWSPVSYDIVYTLNGGLSNCLPSTGEYDKVVRICKPYRNITLKGDANGVEGVTIGDDTAATYEFSGWTSEDIYTDYAKYGTSESNVTSSWTDGNTKNKAEYYKNLYYDDTERGTVNLVANWGTVAMVTPTLTKPGWRCTWNTKKDGSGTSYTPGASANFSSSQTLYAQCQPNTYKINYTLNNGTEGSSKPLEGNIDVALNISNPTKTVTITPNANSTGATIGSAVTSTITFAGWVSSSSGGLNTSTAKTGVTSTSINTSWSGTATTNEYFMNLASPNGTVTMAANWTAKTINLPTISKTGYTCTWNTKSDGTGTSYNSGASYTIASNSATSITIYAVCTPNSYTITANSQEGIIPSTSGWSVATGNLTATKNVTYDSTYGTLPTPTRSGYLFGGWSLTSNQNIANQNLPSEYVQVNYIESTGTQYIDTGFVASNGFKGLFEIEFTNLDGNYVAGSHNISSPYGRNGVGLNGSLNWEIGTGDSCPAASSTVYTEKRYKLDFSTIKGNSYLNVNGERLITTSDSTARSSNNIFLFYNQYSQNMGGSTAKMKLYSAKIYDNSTLVRDFIPCYRKSDNVVGLYDKVNSTFYTNAGSGTFTYGSAMNYVTSSSTVKTIGNHNIYANWVPNSYTVTANAQGGTISSTAGWTGTGNTATKSISYNEPYGTLPSTSRAGFTLNGYSLVPNEYQQVEYIESDGNQFISTGVQGNARWEFDIQFTNTTIRQLMGYGGSSNEYWGLQTNGLYGITDNSWTSSPTAGTRDKIIHNYGENSTYYLNVNGSIYGDGGSDVSSKTYKLFNLSNGGSFGVKSKFYRLKTIQGGVLIRDFIPCYRKSDGEIGLYDRVNNKFYTNTGSKPFAMGSSVTLPSDYQRVDYIRGTGTQWINTGFNPNQDTRIVIKASSTGPYSVYGTNSAGAQFNLTGGGTGMYYYWGSNSYTTITDYFGQIHVFEQDKNICKVDGNNYYTYTYANWSSNVPIALFGRLNANNQINDIGGTVDIYYARIYNNGEIVRDFIPVYRKSDGTIGLYDVINAKFYTNAGTGTFNKGSNSDTTYSDKVTVPGSHTVYANWGRNNYTVTYNSNGSNIGTKTAAYGTYMDSVSAPSVSGYDFEGYYSSTSATDILYNLESITSQGVWRINFGPDHVGVPNGWAMNTSDSDKYLQVKFSVTDSNASSTPTLDFNDVNINASKIEKTGTNTWTYYVYLDITSDMLAYRYNTPYDTSLRFIDINGVSTSSTVSVEFAVLNGKKYHDNTGKSVWFYDTTSDMTLYAKLKQNSYTVKYNVNGGTGTFVDQIKIHGTALNLHNGSPTRTGYTFQGWGVGDYNNNSCSNVTTAGYSSNNGVYTANANVLLCAVWEKTNIAVSSIPVGSYISYTANGYSSWRVLFNNSGQIDIVSTSSTENVTLSGNSGYTESVQKLNSAATKYVTGLATSARSIGCTADSQATISVDNRQVGLTGSPYTDTYYTKDFNQLTNLGMVNTGQQVWLASRLGTDEKNYGFTTNSFGCVRVITTTGALDYKQLQNYTITGWKDAREVTSGFRPVVSFPSGLSVISGSGTENDPYVLGDSSSQTYTVKYNLNGGNGTFTNQTKNHGVTLNLHNGSPTKTGYNFQGWGVGDYNNNSCTNATTAIYPSTNGIYTANANVLLCAVWEESTGTDTPSEDTTNPTINVSNTISGSAYNGTWTNKSIDSAITFSDSGSGIDPSTLSYKCNSHSDWVAIDNSSTTSATDSWGSDRNETCYYRIADNSGNYATTVGFTIKIDKTAPTAPTYAAYYSSNNSSYTSGSTASSEVYTTISSTDSGSGVSYIQYKETSAGTSSWATLGFGKSPLTQNGTTWSGSEHWTFTNGRNQTFHFRACDTLGNCSGTSNNFNVVYATQTQVFSVNEDFADTSYASGITVNNPQDSGSMATYGWSVSGGQFKGTAGSGHDAVATISFTPTSNCTLSFDYNLKRGYMTYLNASLDITLNGTSLVSTSSSESGTKTANLTAGTQYTLTLTYKAMGANYGDSAYIDNLKIQ